MKKKCVLLKSWKLIALPLRLKRIKTKNPAKNQSLFNRVCYRCFINSFKIYNYPAVINVTTSYVPKYFLNQIISTGSVFCFYFLAFSSSKKLYRVEPHGRAFYYFDFNYFINCYVTMALSCAWLCSPFGLS